MIFPCALRSSSKIDLENSYDIVVISAGAAGSIVSAKVADALDMKILVVKGGINTHRKERRSYFVKKSTGSVNVRTDKVKTLSKDFLRERTTIR